MHSGQFNFSQDDMITSGRTGLEKVRLSKSEVVSLPRYHIVFLIKGKKNRKNKRGKTKKKNKGDSRLLTVFGHPPWAASEEKTPQSGLIR